MLLRLVGVSAKTVAEEYALTALELREVAAKLVEALLRNHILHLDEESVKKLVMAKKEYMEGLCKVVEEEYGGAEEYLRDYLRLRGEAVEALKNTLVVNKKPTFTERRVIITLLCPPTDTIRSQTKAAVAPSIQKPTHLGNIAVSQPVDGGIPSPAT